MLLTQTHMANFTGEALRYDSDYFPIVIKSSISNRTHQAYIGTAIHKYILRSARRSPRLRAELM